MPGKHAEPFLLTVQPEDPPGSFQHGREEFMYILSGRLEFSVGEHTTVLGPGDSIYFNPQIKHVSRAAGRQAVKFLSVFVQDGSEEGSSARGAKAGPIRTKRAPGRKTRGRAEKGT